MTRTILAPLLVLTAACSGTPTEPAGNARYLVTGTATRVSVNFTKYQRGTGPELPFTVTLPYTYAMAGVKKGEFLQMSAQIVNTSGGLITVTVERSGAACQITSVQGFGATATAACVF